MIKSVQLLNGISFLYKVKLKAGVRGRIQSPYLFAVFADNVLVKLRNSTLGCHINRTCYNAIIYKSLFAKIDRNILNKLNQIK